MVTDARFTPFGDPNEPPMVRKQRLQNMLAGGSASMDLSESEIERKQSLAILHSQFNPQLLNPMKQGEINMLQVLGDDRNFPTPWEFLAVNPQQNDPGTLVDNPPLGPTFNIQVNSETGKEQESETITIQEEGVDVPFTHVPGRDDDTKFKESQEQQRNADNEQEPDIPESVFFERLEAFELEHDVQIESRFRSQSASIENIQAFAVDLKEKKKNLQTERLDLSKVPPNETTEEQVARGSKITDLIESEKETDKLEKFYSKYAIFVRKNRK